MTACHCLLLQDHDGPLTQYFPREGRALSLPHPGHGRRRHSLTVLTTKAGESLFLHEERGCLWLWTLAVAATPAAVPDAAPDAALPEPFLCVDFPEDAAQGHRMVPVFPLSASSEDVIASGRCLQVPDDEGLCMSVRVGRDGASATDAANIPSAAPAGHKHHAPAAPSLARSAAVS